MGKWTYQDFHSRAWTGRSKHSEAWEKFQRHVDLGLVFNRPLKAKSEGGIYLSSPMGRGKGRDIYTLRKHAYSNILKIPPPKTESFQLKILIFFHISAQNIDFDKRIGYSLDIMRQTACLVVNPIIVDGYASLFNCTTAVRASDSMTASS